MNTMQALSAIRDLMAPLKQVLRATTHVCSNGAQPSGGRVFLPVDRLPELDFHKHGNDPQWQRDQIAKAEAQDMQALQIRADFESECG